MADRAVLADATLRASPRLAIVALVVTGVSGVLPPSFNLLSGVAAGKVADAVTAGERSLGPVAPTMALISVVYLAMHVLGPVRGGIGTALMRRVDTSLTAEVMETMSRPRGVAHLEDPEVLDAIAQVQGVVTTMSPGIGVAHLVQVWTQRLQNVLSLLIVATFSPWIALVLLVGHAGAYRWRRWHCRETMTVVTDRTEDMRRSHYIRRLAVEPDAAKEARVFGLAGWMRHRYRHEFLAVLEEVWRKRRRGGLVALAASGGTLVLEAGALALVARAAVRGDIGFGAAVAYSHVVVATSGIGQFDEAHLYVTEGAMALRKLRDLTHSAARVEDTVSAKATPAPAGGLPRSAIRFEDVHFTYPDRRSAVYAGLDLTIEAGRSLAIVGQNGAGKTTLVKLLARFYDPTSGRITVDGVDLRSLDPAAWQRRVAAIFQDFVSYKLTAADNVAFGALHLPPAAGALDQAAQLAGATDVLDKLPAGWDTVLSRQFDDGTDLSGGEWQRLALARAVYAVQAGAGVLILDEPTAALDVRGEASVYDRFLELTRGLTTIVVSHRFSTVRRADRIVVIEHGRVVEDGTHASLLAAGGRYALMYDLQAARFRDDDRRTDENPPDDASSADLDVGGTGAGVGFRDLGDGDLDDDLDVGEDFDVGGAQVGVDGRDLGDGALGDELGVGGARVAVDGRDLGDRELRDGGLGDGVGDDLGVGGARVGGDGGGVGDRDLRDGDLGGGDLACT